MNQAANNNDRDNVCVSVHPPWVSSVDLRQQTEPRQLQACGQCAQTLDPSASASPKLKPELGLRAWASPTAMGGRA